MRRDEKDELTGVLSSLREKLERERGLRGRLRSLSTRVRLALVVGLLLVLVAGLALLSLRADAGDHPLLRLLAIGAVLAGGVILLARACLWPLSRREPGSAALFALGAVALLLPVAVAVLPSPYTHAPEVCVGAPFGEPGFWASVGECLAFGVVLGAPFFVLLWLLERRDGPDRGRGLLLAGAAGLAGVLALLLHCPLVSTSHLLLGHATVPFALLVLAILIFGRRKK
jgi:hypothetical protein